MANMYRSAGKLEAAEEMLLQAKMVVDRSQGAMTRSAKAVRVELHSVYFERLLADKSGSRSGKGSSCSPVVAAIEKLAAAERFRLSTEYVDRERWDMALDERIVLNWNVYGRSQEAAQPILELDVQPLSILDSPNISKCESVGEGEIDGELAAKYLIEHVNRRGVKGHVLMWMDRDVGLPIQAFFKAIEPEGTMDAMARYSYGPDVDKPTVP